MRGILPTTRFTYTSVCLPFELLGWDTIFGMKHQSIKLSWYPIRERGTAVLLGRLGEEAEVRVGFFFLFQAA